jgi:hypothetical protein
MSARDIRDKLVSATSSAYRARDAEGRIISDAAWMDLDEEGRKEAFEVTLKQRKIEAALDAQGLSSTARAVLKRILLSK